MPGRQLSREEKDRGRKQPTYSCIVEFKMLPSWAIVSMNKRGIIHTAYDGSKLGSRSLSLHGKFSSNRPKPVP